jgi:hypothetical protein
VSPRAHAAAKALGFDTRVARPNADWVDRLPGGEDPYLVLYAQGTRVGDIASRRPNAICKGLSARRAEEFLAVAAEPTDKLGLAIVDRPDNRLARWAFAAKWLEPARAEFILLQLVLAEVETASNPGQVTRKRLYRAQQILNERGRGWANPIAPYVRRFVFRQGFIEHVTLNGRAFAYEGTWLLSQAPIAHLDLDELDTSVLERFFLRTQALEKIRSLDLSGLGLGDDALKMIAKSPHLGSLRWLSLAANPVSISGVRAIAESRRLPSLRWVNLRGTDFPANPVIDVYPGGVIEENQSPLAEALANSVGHRVPWLSLPYTPKNSEDLLPNRYADGYPC